MPVTLTLAHVLGALAEQTADALPRQVTDLDLPDRGAYIHPDWGVADPSHVGTSRLLTSLAYLYLAPDEARPPEPDRATLLTRMRLAADYLLTAQRPSGLIDLRNCNYDSSPDTGFAVQALCTVIELGRPRAGGDSEWADILARVEMFVRWAVPGMLTGGFHTPNHRWVITSALAQAASLFPDLDVATIVNAYLAEGIDIDAEGACLERSVGVYDAVCDRSLLLLADHWDAPQARAAAHQNLQFDLYLLHADGTAETGLSRRQDYGTRTVPLGLASSYLHAAYREPNPLFVRAAHELWAQARDASRQEMVGWLAWALLKFGEPPPPSPELPTDFSRVLPLNGLWRIRRGPLSASFFRGVTRLLTLHYGQAQLTSLKISQSYFGVGRFVADTLDVSEGVGVLRSLGQSRPRRPGYDQPLGRPVPPEQWTAALVERELRPVPPAISELEVREVADGFDLRYRTLDGLDRVTTQIALDFPPGGIWETDDSCLKPQAGQVLFLKRGYGAMRHGHDVIQIGPGADGHRTWQMRDAETAPEHVRVLLTFVTPIDHALSIRVRHGL